jgi:hypothetical protein
MLRRRVVNQINALQTQQEKVTALLLLRLLLRDLPGRDDP